MLSLLPAGLPAAPLKGFAVAASTFARVWGGSRRALSLRAWLATEISSWGGARRAQSLRAWLAPDTQTVLATFDRRSLASGVAPLGGLARGSLGAPRGDSPLSPEGRSGLLASEDAPSVSPELALEASAKSCSSGPGACRRRLGLELAIASAGGAGAHGACCFPHARGEHKCGCR